MPKYRETVDVDGLPRPGTPPPRQNGSGIVPRGQKSTVVVTIQKIEVESDNPDLPLRYAVGPTASVTEVVDQSFEGVTDIAEPDEAPQFELSRDIVIEDHPPPNPVDDSPSRRKKPRRKKPKKD